MTTFIDLEIIHSLPFSNANRDDAGQPKTVQVGGSTRGRLSSQSVKRAARFFNADKISGFGLNGDTSGGKFYRTRYAKNLILSRLQELGGSEEDVARVDELFGKKRALGSLAAGKGADESEKSDVLIVLTTGEIDALAQSVLDGDVTEKSVTQILRNSAKRDIALWGRFFASSDDATLDGAAQVAHAFTTHSVNVEPDFFVGLDDAADLFADHAGAGHPGDAFYLTGTFYKYANFSVEEAILNLLNARAEKGQLVLTDISEEEVEDTVDFLVEDFIKSLSLSVPQGKIRSTAHQTLPSLVRVAVRDNRPVSGATAFDAAVPAHVKNVPAESIQKLANEHKDLAMFVGAPKNSFVLCRTDVKEEASTLGQPVDSLDVLIESVQEAIRPVVVQTIQRLQTGN